MKTCYVNDLQKGMSLLGETFAVKEVQQTETKAKKPYYRVSLIDKTGTIEGNIWSDNFPNLEKSALKVGRVVMIDATVEEYKDSLNLNITKVSSVNESTLDEYIEGSDFDLDELLDKVVTYISEIEDKEIKGYLESLFSDKEFVTKFKTMPAAEFVHHSFRGGLLEHVTEMLDLAQPLRSYYPEANFDLVTAGVILHDIGKLQELEVVEMVVQRSKAGSLIGHIALGFEFVSNTAKEYLNEEKLLILKHIILSHHGSLEFGSPVVPSTLEAAIVNQLDLTSSQVRLFQKIIRKSKNKSGDFTQWDKYIGTRIYKAQQQDELRLV